MLLGTLEAGGTKMVMGLADADGNILKRDACPTRLPEETLQDIIAFFAPHKIDALGIASFGPVDLNPASPTFGSITNTPKLPWRNFPLYARLKNALKVPCAIDTDVNGAVLAEARLGAMQGLDNCLYVTVGTGIGGGVMSSGHLVHGLIHPEWGHIIVSRHPDDPLLKG
ncbi:MAG: ROK family protein, partial [Clostridiales bacterium]|nr:ROK family protein [Clostridiales bacterium]